MSKTKIMTQHSCGPSIKVIFTIVSEFIQQANLNKFFSFSGHQTVVESLLKNGADVNSKSNYENTPLIKAAEKGNFQIKYCKAFTDLLQGRVV